METKNIKVEEEVWWQLNKIITDQELQIQSLAVQIHSLTEKINAIK